MDKFSVTVKPKKNALYSTVKLPKQKEINPGNKKFLSIIAHDIKTPMGSIIGFLNLVKDGMDEWDRDKIEENIDIALISAKRTYALLDNLLEWANSENIFKSFRPEVINFNGILKNEIENIEITSSQKQINIQSMVFPDEKVFADVNMVKSILRNLLTNAIKYSYLSGNIVISSKRDKGFLEITIKDYGVGINAKTLSTVFSTNNYISTPGTQSEPGTGYGLLLCKELIEINKGKIWIVGNAEKGSEFKFTLPLATL